ncbi:cytochrome c oxidase subunit IV-domain-containing protein [Coprinopsis sp. MPI-PUGE-AT-0042]|nr:cytochrome c oxidase subunit IV-domain-containing protein [Coprinopsis sp. MPI-PUGE-AT-0042]
MQSTTALRIAARSVARRQHLSCSSSSSFVLRQQQRSLATAAASHAEHHATASPTTGSTSKVAPIALSNVEAKWAGLSEAEQAAVHEQLEVIQQKDWKELSVDEKKAAYYVAFGPHGPRTPTSKPGDLMKILLATSALVGVAGTLFYAFKSIAPAAPKTITKEWEEAATERAKELNLDPITGISSADYKGKGFVTHK